MIIVLIEEEQRNTKYIREEVNSLNSTSIEVPTIYKTYKIKFLGITIYKRYMQVDEYKEARQQGTLF